MNNKSKVVVFLSFFGFSLSTFADDPIEIIIVAQAPSSPSPSYPTAPTGNTPVPNPTGMNQGPGFDDAKAKERAAKEKGEQIQKCIKARKGEYLKKVEEYKLVILDGAPTSCKAQHFIDWGLNALFGGQNSYTECIVRAQLTYSEYEKLAYSDYEREAEACTK